MRQRPWHLYRHTRKRIAGLRRRARTLRGRVLRHDRKSRKPAVVPPRPELKWSLDDDLVWLSERDAITLRMAAAGIAVFGTTGSGKTSAVGKELARAFLRERHGKGSGFGGIVFTVKPGEREFWTALCKEANRLDDLQVFDASPSSTLRFDFIDYEASRPGLGAGLTEDLVALLSGLADILTRKSSGAGGDDNGQFWRLSVRSLMRNAIDLCLIATGTVTIPMLQEIVLTAPTSTEQIRSQSWRTSSTFFHMTCEARRKPKTPRQQHDLDVILNYFGLEWVQLHEKTRSIILTTFSGLVDVLGRGLLNELHCSGTTITPEAAQEGKIILIDLPLKTFGVTGLVSQTIWKQAFQRSIERRDIRLSPRPVFLWLDEASHFVGEGDMFFQTTARSSLCATVMLAQNIGAFRSAFGDGDRGTNEANALLGNLATKFFCANGDTETNNWAAALAGQHRDVFFNSGTSGRNDPLDLFTGLRESQVSSGMSEQLTWEVPPSAFQTLRTGAEENDWRVDTIAIRSGGAFKETGKVWLSVTFRQRP